MEATERGAADDPAVCLRRRGGWSCHRGKAGGLGRPAGTRGARSGVWPPLPPAGHAAHPVSLCLCRPFPRGWRAGALFQVFVSPVRGRTVLRGGRLHVLPRVPATLFAEPLSSCPGRAQGQCGGVARRCPVLPGVARRPSRPWARPPLAPPPRTRPPQNDELPAPPRGEADGRVRSRAARSLKRNRPVHARRHHSPGGVSVVTTTVTLRRVRTTRRDLRGDGASGAWPAPGLPGPAPAALQWVWRSAFCVPFGNPGPAGGSCPR